MPKSNNRKITKNVKTKKTGVALLALIFSVMGMGLGGYSLYIQLFDIEKTQDPILKGGIIGVWNSHDTQEDINSLVFTKIDDLNITFELGENQTILLMFNAYAYTIVSGSRAGIRFYVNGSESKPLILVDTDVSPNIVSISLHGIFKNKPAGIYTVSVEAAYAISPFALAESYLTAEVIQN